MRQTFKRIIAASGDLDLVGLARDGEDAVSKARELRPDVVSMDINMPKLDGITALQLILQEKICPVVMVSSLTQQGTATTFECLELGAFDFVAKPDGTVSNNMGLVADELISKLKAAASRGIVDRMQRNRERRKPYQAPVRSTFENITRKRAIAIGISTGGPATLQEVLPQIPADVPASIFLVQHMPPAFIASFAKRLDEHCAIKVVEGRSGIELDKTILEQIGDPLVHVIRNAVDHGIEPPEERRAKGKDVSGQLTLRAIHEAGGVSIEVRDDGRGLDAGALKRKAFEKGLLTPEAAAGMSDEAAFQLVFLPGLTTAAKVTDVSGRGVGMDVVRSNVRNLHGTIEIRSKQDQGTTFRIKLPTSLMISKGILLEAGAQEYILPLSNIRDMVKMPAEEAHDYRGLTLAQVRGNIYSIFSLAEMLGLAPTKSAELSVAIVEAGTVQYGLVVDKFLSEVEVLVKPLSGGLEQCKEFQGAAIMGDGRVVLVLNALECHSLDRTACS
jgi:DNA-binding NarL/FixJ family response regulator